MNYNKPALKKDELAELVISRGMNGISPADLAKVFQDISYYRLSGYWLKYKNPDDTLSEEASWARIKSIYMFDKELRAVIFRAIKDVEIKLRALLVDYFAENGNSAFAYCYKTNFPEMLDSEYNRQIEAIAEQAKNSDTLIMAHYRRKYTKENLPPTWIAMEMANLSNIVYLSLGTAFKYKQRLAKVFCLDAKTVSSWLRPLRLLRNKCAHHERVWDVNYSYMRPIKPTRIQDSHWKSTGEVTSVYFRIAMLAHLLKYIPMSSLNMYQEIALLVNRYPDVPVQRYAGFPANWQDTKFWTQYK